MFYVVSNLEINIESKFLLMFYVASKFNIDSTYLESMLKSTYFSNFNIDSSRVPMCCVVPCAGLIGCKQY